MQPDRPLRILVAEDDAALSVMLSYNLEAAGHTVMPVDNGLDALREVTEWKPDLVLLDWMMPGLSGVDLCRRLRMATATRYLPVIMLTARGEERDSVHALDLGADDYLVKPCGMDVLHARVRAVMRRSMGRAAGASALPVEDVLNFADVTLDHGARRVTRGGAAIALGPTEYRILLHLMRHPRRVFSRAEILASAWDDGIHVEERTVDVHIRRLRLALNASGGADLIRTVRSSGYMLDDGKVD
ncbi:MULTISPECIES: response regulator [Komagataeibacter]|mgnify:FL=1|uniref:Phosphate regulon transcriptional regulatory protein PhoB n=3 Tax=Komagataeibacter saccharivorans TaxID=265959 RepID=A0A347WB03_9PROT|nr:response regulator [Komagataeibacter saccharivorans]AXY22046.1 Phosphate regulon transcriptional regulatory protein PhoB [Komagataeibacter saccharivorans]PYD49735.1 DNA-binding response regulator [Komagataeibacter saccharivorans]QBL94024.1 Phosphate regulon transcriptional regulatory protein PhoB [Komagataeibacter saccharivorans]GBQ37438.1 phosphate regulon response regulator PhoB [Komagataeibacter saccharivorans NRIC 0614]